MLWNIDEFFLFVFAFLSWPFPAFSEVGHCVLVALREEYDNREQRTRAFQKPRPSGNGNHSSLIMRLSNRSHHLQLRAVPPTRKMFPSLEEGIRKEAERDSIHFGPPLWKWSYALLPGLTLSRWKNPSFISGMPGQEDFWFAGYWGRETVQIRKLAIRCVMQWCARPI